MCFSLPRLRVSSVVKQVSSGRTTSEGVVEGMARTSGGESIVDALLMLDANSGVFAKLVSTSGRGEYCRRRDRACVSGRQQNVSRFHSRQLRFSSRLPSSNAADVFENTVHVRMSRIHLDNDSPVQRPKRFSTERVSMVCILSRFRFRSECSGRKGMMTVNLRSSSQRGHQRFSDRLSSSRACLYYVPRVKQSDVMRCVQCSAQGLQRGVVSQIPSTFTSVVVLQRRECGGVRVRGRSTQAIKSELTERSDVCKAKLY